MEHDDEMGLSIWLLDVVQELYFDELLSLQIKGEYSGTGGLYLSEEHSVDVCKENRCPFILAITSTANSDIKSLVHLFNHKSC